MLLLVLIFSAYFNFVARNGLNPLTYGHLISFEQYVLARVFHNLTQKKKILIVDIIGALQCHLVEISSIQNGECLMCYNCTGSSDKFIVDAGTPCIHILGNASSEFTVECSRDQVCVHFIARKIMNVPLDRSVPMHHVRRGCVDWQEGLRDFDYCDNISSDVVHDTLFTGGRHKYYFYETTCVVCNTDLCNIANKARISLLTFAMIIIARGIQYCCW